MTDMYQIYMYRQQWPRHISEKSGFVKTMLIHSPTKIHPDAAQSRTTTAASDGKMPANVAAVNLCWKFLIFLKYVCQVCCLHV